MKPKKQTVKHIVVISDLHSGDRNALCPARIRMTDGGYYAPTGIQSKLLETWNLFWSEVRGIVGNNPWHLVVNGDTINGTPHGAICNWSANMVDQAECAEMLLKPRIAACRKSGGDFWMVKGTEAHVGKSACEEEKLAKRLEARCGEYDGNARWELWLKLDRFLVHFLHHIGTTGSMAYESSALMGELTAMLAEAGATGQRPPDVLIRSHRHRAIEVRKPVANRLYTIATTAAWQLKTPFSYKIPGARVSSPEIGGLVIVAGDKEPYTKQITWSVARPPVEVQR